MPHGAPRELPLDVFLLWAKGAPRKAEDPIHPLVCHLIDVGAVAARLWSACSPISTQRWFAAQVGIEPDAAAQWAVFCAAAHDLGKASPAFQKRESLPSFVPHGTISTVLLRDLLAAPPCHMDRELADRFATVVGGHHGAFPGIQDVNVAARQRDHIGRGPWKRRQQMLWDEMIRLLHMAGTPPPAFLTNAGALWLAGFISVADWIGSNSEFFPFAAPAGQESEAVSLNHYAIHAHAQAAKALATLGWTAWPHVTETRAFRDLFPFPPNDLQAKTVGIADGFQQPALVVIEAPMGEGKTEAALYLADRGNAALGMRGHYIALPTQATSNQMFQRVRDFLAHRYPEETVNTQLLHGHASLTRDFQALRTAEHSFLSRLSIPTDHNSGFDGALPGVIAATWFTARKRGLLAPFGVGTIDQALLSVLQTRHYFVRLLGLAGKTVVFDEVHAYDTYMSVLLERLLGWLAALGCSVVILSATLPRARRARLIQAYAQDQSAASLPEDDVAYPRITWRSGPDAGAVSLDVSDVARKRVLLHWSADDDAEGHPTLGPRLSEALRAGGCAAVICNTVRSAQETFQQLRRWLPEEELYLFHARFLYEDRTSREQQVLRLFGKPGEGIGRPHRAVLVATQVIEQSLDLDFDLMASELAPVDLMLQRSGRLHRHPRDERPPQLRDTTLCVLGPHERDGLPVFSPGTRYVYDEHVLLRSWLALRHRHEVAVPADVAPLIELVYDDHQPGPPADPPGLAQRWTDTWEQLQTLRDKHQRAAKDVMILPPEYPPDGFLADRNSRLEEDDPQIHKDLQALTRLGEPTVTAVCLSPAELTLLQPTARDAPTRAAALLGRSVALSDRRVVHDIIRMAPPSSWKTTALLRHCRLIELDAAGEAVIGAYRLRVDPELGVVINSNGEE